MCPHLLLWSNAFMCRSCQAPIAFCSQMMCKSCSRHPNVLKPVALLTGTSHQQGIDVTVSCRHTFRSSSCTEDSRDSVHRQIANQTKTESLSLHLVPTANQSTSLLSCCAHISCADQSFRPSVQERMVCFWSCVLVTIVSWSHLTDH